LADAVVVAVERELGVIVEAGSAKEQG